MSAAPVPPMDNRGFLRWLWRQLTSMRTALILLFLLAIASIPGSIFPQRTIDPVKVREYIEANPGFGEWLDRFGFFDVYGSAWFAAVYLLLFISLIGCVLPRTGAHIRALRSRPPAAPRNLTRLPESRRFVTQGDSSKVIDAARDYFGSHRWRTNVSANGDWIAAEKGYSRETGNLVFHVALLVLLVAIAVGALWGWRGNVIVREGQGFSNTLTQYDAWGGGRFVDSANIPPFAFNLDDFRAEFDRGEAQRGSPTLFEADVTLNRSPGEPSETAMVRVNEPLTIDGVRVYLVGHGYAPRFVVRDGDGKVVFDDAVPFLPQDGNFTSTGVVKVPDANPQLGVQGLFLPTRELDAIRGPYSSFPAPDDPAVFLSAWEGDLGLNSGVPQSVYTIETEAMTQIGLEELAVGQTWNLPNGLGSIEFVGVDRWASFQIADDPGKTLALIAAVVSMLGLIASLFIRRRRAWVRVTAAEDGTTVVDVAGLAKTDAGDLPDEIDALTDVVRTAGGKDA